MEKVDLQQRAIRLIKQLSTEERKAAVDYLSCLQNEEGQNDLPTRGLGTVIHELFKPFGGVELEIPPREPMREPPRFD